MNHPASVFEVRGVTVERGVERRVEHAKRRIVEDVSLVARRGEVLALMGENGAGKSTLLKVMSGDVKPDRGDTLLNGRALSEWSPLEQARQRAVLPQETTLAFAFTALAWPRDANSRDASSPSRTRERSRAPWKWSRRRS